MSEVKTKPAPIALKHYVLDECIDRGGMGEVFRARDTRLMRPVAIKFLKADVSADDPMAVPRFLREARAASALNHPNIVIIHEIGETEQGSPFIVQELIEGQTLRSCFAAASPPLEVAEVGRQVARALAAAHAAGITHRDVKPENIMLRADGLVKVLDFGLARLKDPIAGTEEMHFETRVGAVVGTPKYLSPEQASGAPAGPPADVFSLGVVLYEMLASRAPFTGATVMNIMAAVMTAHPTPLPTLRVDAPRTLTDLIHKMLDKDPARRPTCEEVEHTLTSLLGPSAGSEAFARAAAPARAATVGRTRQREQLQRIYVSARDTSGRIAALTGEPGIGKSSLVDDFLRDVQSHGERAVVIRGHCSESLAGAEAFLPILEALDDLRSPSSGESFDQVVRNIAPTWFAQLSSAAEQKDIGNTSSATGAVSSERMKRELGTLFEQISAARPVILVIDDLHWADVSTIDMLNYLAGRFADMRLMVLTGYRPSDMALTKHPFLAIRSDLEAHGLLEEIPLDFLSTEEVAEYLDLQFPVNSFPENLATIIHTRTDGSPLFMGDLVRYLRDTGGIVEKNGEWHLAHDVPVSPDSLPATLRGMIARKIERVDAEDRLLLDAASVQGREFDSTIVGEALGMDALQVEDRLERLDRVHVFIRQVEETEFPDRALTLKYQFVHVLYQNVLYDALRPTRRVALSGSIARAMSAHHGSDAGAVAGRLAMLYEAARDFGTSAEHYLLAAQRAVALFAYPEALSLAERGVHAVRALPDGPDRQQLELGLQLVCAHALRALKGWASPELERTFARARELCQLLHDPAELFPVHWNIAFFNMIRGDLRAARDQTANLMAQAEASGEPAFLMAVHHVAGVTCEFLGDLVESHRLLERARELHVPAQHEMYNAMFGVDPGMVARAMSSRPLWSLGYPDQALARNHETISIGRQQQQPATLVFGLVVAQGVRVYRGEAAEAIALGDEIKGLCREYAFPQEAEWANAFQGAALSIQGRPDLGMEKLRASLDALHALQSGLVRTMFLSLLADACYRAGKIEPGLAAVAEGFAHAERTLEGGFVGELHRTRGELLMLAGDDAGAEASLRDAVAYTRAQNARSLELRATTALAKCLAARGAKAEAMAELKPLYEWFTEGHDTADLTAAKALLTYLS